MTSAHPLRRYGIGADPAAERNAMARGGRFDHQGVVGKIRATDRIRVRTAEPRNHSRQVT